MSKVLKSNLRVDGKGISLVGLDILKSYIDTSLVKIPFKFNDAENALEIDIGIDQEYIVEYEKNTIRQQRRFLHFNILDKKIRRDEEKFRQALELFKEKLASIEDLSKVQEEFKDIKDSYDTESTFCFNFKKSSFLNKFINKNYDLELLELNNKGSAKKIIFNFKSIKDITPRIVNTTINQGTLLIQKIGPPKVVKHFIDKNYVIIKLHYFMDNHSKELKNVYDILITCNEKIVSQIFQSKRYNNPNVFFGKYTKERGINAQNFYISKIKFGEFLKSFGQKFLYIKDLLSNEVVEIPFKEKKFDNFLLKSKRYDIETLNRIKEKANKGFSEYYTFYKEFLEDIKKITNEKDFDNEYKDFKPIFDNFEKLDFSSINKREIFDVEVKIHFLDNLEILITRDNELKVDYSLDILQEGLNINFQRAKEKFQKEYEDHLSKKDLYKISEEYYKTLYLFLHELKFKSMLNLHTDFIRDCLYYFAILKKNIDLIKQRFSLGNKSLLETVSIVLSVLNAFYNHFPKESSLSLFDKFFNSKFTKFSEKNPVSLVKLKIYCRDMIYLFEAAKDLKILKREFKDKFQSHFEFGQIIKHIEKKLCLKLNLNTEELFNQILGEIKEGIKYKQETEKNFEEITAFIETQLKEEFTSEIEFKKTTESIEQLLMSKLVPKIDFDNILKQINSFFKKKLTKKGQVNEIIEYIEKNLKNEFENKRKFNAILKKIRNTYENKIDNDEKYSNILNQLENIFKNLNTKEDIHKIQLFIEENLDDIFGSNQESKKILNQIDKAFLNKLEPSKELEDIIQLSFAIVKLLITDTAWFSILSGSVFGLFILALNMEKLIPLGSICDVLDILSTSLSLQVKKVIETEKVKRGRRIFDNLKITDEETRQKIRNRLVELLLGSQAFQIFKSKKDERIRRLSEEFKMRIDFFTRHEQFADSLETVSKKLIDRFIKDFILKIKHITKREDKDSKVSELTTRLTFFNIFSNFRKNLISLKSEIKEIYNETPEIYKSISVLLRDKN